MPTRYEQELQRLSQLPRAQRFEELLEFPAQHTFKVIGRSDGFSLAVEELLRAAGHGQVLLVERPSSGGKYLSLTFTLTVHSGAALDSLYCALEQLPGLVDDSLQSRSLYKSQLNLAGFSVVEAKDGVEALKFLHDDTFTLVILDLWMEGVDGFKVLQLMKMNPQLKGIPVIVLSARSVPADIQKAIDLGARDFLPKMTTIAVKLLEKVKEILASR